MLAIMCLETTSLEKSFCMLQSLVQLSSSLMHAQMLHYAMLDIYSSDMT